MEMVNHLIVDEKTLHRGHCPRNHVSEPELYDPDSPRNRIGVPRISSEWWVGLKAHPFGIHVVSRRLGDMSRWTLGGIKLDRVPQGETVPGSSQGPG